MRGAGGMGVDSSPRPASVQQTRLVSFSPLWGRGSPALPPSCRVNLGIFRGEKREVQPPQLIERGDSDSVLVIMRCGTAGIHDSYVLASRAPGFHMTSLALPEANVRERDTAFRIARAIQQDARQAPDVLAIRFIDVLGKRMAF